jgi:nucleoside phosphorylase
MKVLVTFAVDAEFAPWRRMRDFRRTALGDSDVYEARLGEADLRVVVTGIGPSPASRAVRAALSERPDLCISSGLVGALRPAYQVGEILAAHTVGSSAGQGIRRSDANLLEHAIRCGATPVGRFWTSETLVRTPKEKSALSPQADAVEMESYAVLDEAARWDVPATAIRAVSDMDGEELPYDFDRARDARGRIRLPGLLVQIARRPHRLPGLLRLGRQCRQAAASLAQFLDLYIGSWQAAVGESELFSEVGAT